MKALSSILLGALAVGAASTLAAVPPAERPRAPRPELAYLQAVNSQGPPKDPQMLFLLMAEYANANRHREGAEFLEARRKAFDSQLSDPQRALYLTAIAALRAGAAHQIPLLQRVAWVRETIAMLDQAERLTGGQVFVVRWMSGVVRSQLPDRFHQKQKAYEDLEWVLANSTKAPDQGWIRPAALRLAVLHREDGDSAKAQRFLTLSGASSFETPITLSPYNEDPATGHTFTSRSVQEIVLGRVYQTSGYDFAELYFVVSRDGRELLAIDAGTRPDSVQAAYAALRAHAPRLPELTTVFVTHSHWDHVGGHRFFRSLQPVPRFYARENFAETLELGANGPQPMAKRFFGSRFNPQYVEDFRPDVTVSERREISVGGTRIVLEPTSGGETRDALLVLLPDEGVLFVGDVLMPYLGAPFLDEGGLPGLLEAIDAIARENPRILLHGHDPLTRLFPTPAVLVSLKPHLQWLQSQVIEGIRQGTTRTALQQANLIPPGLLAGDPAVHLPYLVLRENVINRLYNQHVGYWQPDLEGVDYLSDADRGALLVDYIGVSEGRLADAVKRMIDDGNYELAAKALGWTKDRFPKSRALSELERQVYFKLAEKYQGFSPFKYIVYTDRMRTAGAAAEK
ncbi:MAG TPA: MBL fold metallo-hydrolase [Thermoanaerobaculia bacterium]|nr:MBL fold metallo-hydrolase [Thermoanaerobaculia bacterium]